MCQSYLNNNTDRIKEAIQMTAQDWREHAFAFNQDSTSDIVIGDCNEVEKPTIENEIGTFHVHTIENSRPSEEDFNIFTKSQDKLMCYARPIDDLWSVRCYDKDLGVCGELEVR